MSYGLERFVSDLNEPSLTCFRAKIQAVFNGRVYELGTAVPVNPIGTEVVELLRHLADEIELGA
jgi:hypothetical protein